MKKNEISVKEMEKCDKNRKKAKIRQKKGKKTKNRKNQRKRTMFILKSDKIRFQ